MMHTYSNIYFQNAMSKYGKNMHTKVMKPEGSCRIKKYRASPDIFRGKTTSVQEIYMTHKWKYWWRDFSTPKENWG